METLQQHEDIFLALRFMDQFKLFSNSKGTIFISEKYYPLLEAPSGASHHLLHLFNPYIYFIRL